MDFQLTTDQADLQSAFRDFCSGQFDVDRLRHLEGSGFDRDQWQALAEMGVFGLRRSEADGGVGLGMAEAALVFEELGRAIVPGPILWTHLGAGLEGELGAAAASGDLVVGGLDVPGGSGPLLVEHFVDLDVLIVITPESVQRYTPSTLDSVALDESLDPLSPITQLAALEGGEVVGDAETAQRLRLQGTALVAAMQLGIAEAQTDAASAYALEREQFDRPIGSFQAIKHILADMVVRAEVARAAVYAAGVTLDDPGVGDPARAAAVAKICAGKAASLNAKSSVQVHGGMGYTWEVPVHYYLKRAWLLDSVFGSQGQHALEVAGTIVADAVA